MKKLALCFVLLCCLAASVRAEYFCRVKNFAADNGMLQTHISNAVQDNTGFIWFATWNGLVRFDGIGFTTFKPVLSSGGTIFSNRIYNIKRSSETNGLWCISSENRLYHFDKEKCMFSDVLRELGIASDKRVKVLTPLGNGVTWVTFKDYSCLRLVDADYRKGHQYYPVGDKALLGSRQIIAIAGDDNGDEWVLTDRGAVCTSRRQLVRGTFHFVKTVSRQTFLVGKEGNISAVSSDGKARNIGSVTGPVNYVVACGKLLLLATDNGIWSYDTAKKSFGHYSMEPAIYLYGDSRGRIWSFGHDHRAGLLNVQTREIIFLEAHRADKGSAMKNPQLVLEDASGTLILKPEQGVLSYYDEQARALQPCRFYEGSSPVTYAPEDISKFFVDHQRNLWILQTHAAECITFSHSSFTHCPNATRQESRAIFRDRGGREWYSDRSLCLYERQHGYLSPSGRWQSVPVPFTRMPAYCIQEDSQQRLWIGTKGDGVYLLTPMADGSYLTEHFLHDDHTAASLCSDTVYAILPAADGSMLLGSYGQGLSVAKQAAGGAWSFEQVKGFPQNVKIRCMAEPSRGIFLIGTTNGIITADLRSQDHPRYYHNVFRNEEWGLKGNDIMSILKHDGHWYACIFGSGISRILSSSLTSDTLHFQNYFIPPTATADQIKTAASDGRFIWLFSEQAITRFMPSTGSFTIYDRSHFIGDFTFAEGAPIVAGKTITAGTSDGVLSFLSDVKTSNVLRPRIVLTGIQYQNDMSIQPLNDIQELVIKPNQRSFSLYLSALDYDEKGGTRFRYQLEGYDQGWNYTSESQHAINYSGLPPGDYTLTIQATNNEGEWDQTVRQIPVTIIPLFTETVWFKVIIILLLICLFLGMAYAIVYLSRVRHLLQRKYSLLMSVDEFSRDIRIENDEEERQRIAESEQEFMKKSIAFFEDNIGNRGFVVEDLARHLGMSRTAYYNKMKSITGLSPIDFIKQMRIRKALRLMDDASLSITDIAYKVGFSDPKYFSKCFKAEMGMTPTQYIAQRAPKED